MILRLIVCFGCLAFTVYCCSSERVTGWCMQVVSMTSLVTWLSGGHRASSNDSKRKPSASLISTATTPSSRPALTYVPYSGIVTKKRGQFLPKFSAVEKFFLSENFVPKMQNLGPKSAVWGIWRQN